MTNSFTTALASPASAADRASALALYGWLVGQWQFDATVHLPDAGTHRGHGHIAAGWVLDGRAIQDVWVLPGIFHGTTLRVFDPSREVWHILWSDPLHQYYGRQLGRGEGPDIVQLGRNDAGMATRWSFRDISADSFTWRGECCRDDGDDWQLEAEFRCRRVPQ